MGLNLKIARIKKGLTQKQLAEIVGTSPATINKAEKGKIDIRIGTLKKISKALGVSISELIEDEQ